MFNRSMGCPEAALPWQKGDVQRWLDASAGWGRHHLLSDTLRDVLTSDDPKATAEAWKALRAGQMPEKVRQHWLHGYSVERLPTRDHGVFAAADDEGVGWALMASPNSPTRGHPKFPQAAQLDYDVSGWMAKRAAASLSL